VIERGNSEVRILLAEDEVTDRIAFERFVSENHLLYRVSAADSLAQALERLKDEPFDLVISDYYLGDGSAIDLLPYLKDCPLIVISGRGSESLAVHVLKSGASDYLVKGSESAYLQSLPFTINEALAGSAKKKATHNLNEERSRLVHTLATVNRELHDFTDVVCHDLKAPLRSITSLANWLQSDYADKIDEAGRENFRILVNCVKRMHELVVGYLSHPTFNRGQMHPEPVGLQLLITEIREILNLPLHFSVILLGPMQQLQGDRLGLKQVLQNLISNAFQYGDKAFGRVEVLCEEQADGWIVSVRDNGPGIAVADFERIFDPFQTFTIRELASKGTGMGLSIVKKLVQSFGGKVWVETNSGPGSNFRFTVPKRTPKPGE